jgi:quercetin dioxygenase-like cupin family protein
MSINISILKKRPDMSTQFSNHLISIIAGQVISRTFTDSMRLEVVSGRIWVTLSGIQDDFWLKTGESLLLEAGRLTVIEAEKETSQIALIAAGEVGYDCFLRNSGKTNEFELKLDIGAVRR